MPTYRNGVDWFRALFIAPDFDAPLPDDTFDIARATGVLRDCAADRVTS